MKLASSAFQEGASIPNEFTCDGQDISPPLRISDVPKGAKSLALIMDDPDAPVGTFVHWVAWNMPPTTTEIQKDHAVGMQGTTGFGKQGYGGPCPPSGRHRYFFKLYALDTELNLPAETGKNGLEKAFKGHILAQAQLIGTYQR